MNKDLSLLLSELYRNHFGKMVAVLMYHTGIQQIAVSEDIVQEAFAIASDKWQTGIPDQPEATLVLINSSPFTKLGQAAALYFGGNKAEAVKILNQLNAKVSESSLPTTVKLLVAEAETLAMSLKEKGVLTDADFNFRIYGETLGGL